MSHYGKRIILLGLCGLVWFGALDQAAYDLWAASLVFLTVTILLSVFSFWIYPQSKSLKLPFGPFVLSALGAMGLSLIHAYDVDTSLFEAWGWVFAFIIFYLFINTQETENDVNRFLSLSGFILIPLVLIGLWQQATGHPDSWGHWEIQATMINSLVLAGFVLYWIYFFLDKSLHGNRRYLVLSLSSLTLLALARSWWAWICFVCGVLHYYRTPLLGWLKRNKRSSALVLGAGSLLGIILLWLKIRSHIGPYQGSSRFYYWWAALKIWRLEPWTGVGLGGFATAYPHFHSPKFQSTLFAHSFPLQWLSETGILGIISILLFVASVIRTPRKNRDSSSSNVFQSTLLSVLMFSLLSINLEYLLNKIVLLLILGAWCHSFEMPRYRIKPLWIGVFSVSLWLVSPFWLRMLLGSQSYMRGVRLEKEGDFRAAEESYQTAVSRDPFLADGFYALARLSQRQFLDTRLEQDRVNAATYLQKALTYKKNPSYLVHDDLKSRDH